MLPLPQIAGTRDPPHLRIHSLPFITFITTHDISNPDPGSALTLTLTLEDLVHAQTPGGLNEMVWKEQETAGVYVAMNKSLDAVYARNSNGTI